MTLMEKIARGETAIRKRQETGLQVPPEWERRLAELKAEATWRGLLREAPRYAPGCLYDYPPGRRVRPILQCLSHPGCPREVVLWRFGLLAEMFTLEKLVGQARRDGEREWMARGGDAAGRERA